MARRMTGIAPWIVVPNGTEALAFYKAAFGAVAVEHHEDAAGVVQVAQCFVGAADFWIQTDAESGPAPPGPRPLHMILSVDEPDVVFARAVAAGATVINPIDDAYGWRIGKIADPFGHVWEIGRRLDS